ncbi:MAG TPA: WhiB family transcriptional regulator [Streptosporangiaceae bacterium]|nr:WhiB family transcriptional regulator [Streptosporangiaceae bacterium]
MGADWRARALCAGCDLELFFAPSREAEAAGICRRCPVRAPCLADALDAEAGNTFRAGIRGGLTPAERAAAARKQPAPQVRRRRVRPALPEGHHHGRSWHRGRHHHGRDRALTWGDRVRRAIAP